MFFRLYLLSSGKLLTSSNCALHHLSEGCLITVIIALTQTRRFTFLHEFRGDNKKHSFVSVRQKQENSIFLSARFVRRFSNQIAWKQNYLFEMSQPQPNASDAWSRLRRDFIYFVRSRDNWREREEFLCCHWDERFEIVSSTLAARKNLWFRASGVLVIFSRLIVAD